MAKHGPKPQPVAERFFRKVQVSDGCWLWGGARNSMGYGNFYLEGRWVLAHRLSLQLAGVDVPPDQFVLHSCDTPACVRPDHLSLGDALANSRDRIAKGRRGSPGPRHASRGENRWSARLTATQVGEIRGLYAAGGITQREISARYGVQQGQISRIVNGARWRPE